MEKNLAVDNVPQASGSGEQSCVSGLVLSSMLSGVLGGGKSMLTYN